MTGEVIDMDKLYKTIRGAGAANIALGILIIVFGITVGVINLVAGGKLMKSRHSILR